MTCGRIKKERQLTQIDLTKYKPIPNYSRYLVNEDGDVWDSKNCTHVAQMNNNGYTRL